MNYVIVCISQEEFYSIASFDDGGHLVFAKAEIPTWDEYTSQTFSPHSCIACNLHSS